MQQRRGPETEILYKLSDMILLFIALWYVPLCYHARNNGRGTLLSELANLHPVLC
jgi:hypothetical protein